VTRERKEYNFTAAICAIVKDADPYLMEWIDYNLLGLQFENIYIYDNSDDFDLQSFYNKTRSHPIYSRVHIMHKTGVYLEEEEEYVQHWAYEDCVWRFGQGFTGAPEYEEPWPESPKHDYMALIDYDEFIVLKDLQKHSTIHDVLAEYLHPYGGALAINWMYYGTSNRTIYAPIPVTKRFQYRDKEVHNVIKTIVKSDDFVQVKNPHAVMVREEVAVHDTTKPGGLQQISSPTGASNFNKPSDVVVLNHYRFMSHKEHRFKYCSRGRVSGTRGGCRGGRINETEVVDHMRERAGEVYDDSAWKFLTSRVPKYGFFDYQEWEDFA
jgi:hypothetical protein